MDKDERVIKVLRLLQESDKELSTTEIAKQTNINRSTVSIILETLATVEIIEKTRQVGKAQLYRYRKSETQ